MRIVIPGLLLLALVVTAGEVTAEDHDEASPSDCAAARAFLAGGNGDLAQQGHFWTIDCERSGDDRTRAAVATRMQQAFDDQAQPAFDRARHGIRLAQLHLRDKQVDEAARLALASEPIYLAQPVRDEFITYAFMDTAYELARARKDVPATAAPHFDAWVTFLVLLADSELYAFESELDLPMTLVLALNNAWTLKDLDRASRHARHMIELRSGTDPRFRPSDTRMALTLAQVANALNQAGRTVEAARIIADDPGMDALAATYASIDALGPEIDDLITAERQMNTVITGDWWQASLKQPMDPSRMIVASTIDFLGNRLRAAGQSAKGDRLQAHQHPGYSR